MLIYQRCGCGCKVRPLQIGGAHTCACAPKSGRARCVRATQKKVATHTLQRDSDLAPFLESERLSEIKSPLADGQFPIRKWSLLMFFPIKIVSNFNLFSVQKKIYKSSTCTIPIFFGSVYSVRSRPDINQINCPHQVYIELWGMIFFTVSNLFLCKSSHSGSCGLMDKALGFEPRDCGFESRQDLM